MAFYVKTQVELKIFQNEGFNEVLSHLVPFLAQHGWKMVYGLQTLVGDLTENLHLWEVEDLNAIPAGLNAAANDPVLGVQLAKLPGLMTKETLQIMVKTPYCP